MDALTNWMLVFLRVSAMLAVFPIFSARNFPVQLRTALGALIAVLVSPTLPPAPVGAGDFWSLIGIMAMEVGVGLLLGFASRRVFFALDVAGSVMSTEIGLSLPAGINPMNDAQSVVPGLVLYYLAAMLWLSLDMHHWMLAGFQKSYTYLPIGGAHLSGLLVNDIISRTSETFLIAVELCAPVMAVSFVISLVFSVLGRAVPQMNVFAESFSLRILVGLSVFGLTMELMSQHIANYLWRLPEDMLHVAQLLGAAEPRNAMSESSVGEKTEQASPKRLEEAFKKGQFAKSKEVQTVFVLVAAMIALMFSGGEIWQSMANTQAAMLSHLHDTPLTVSAMQGYAVNGVLLFGHCVWPVLAATILASLLAGGMQSRFRTASEALEINWERLDPVAGMKRVFSVKSVVPTLIGVAKLAVIIALSYGVIKSVLSDPIFHSSVSVARIAGFMAESSFRIVLRVAMALLVLAVVDYGYQVWNTNQDMMMTKQEVKDESKNTEGNPQVRAQQRRKQRANTKRKMLMEIPKADVVVVNPTHIAIALRYDRKTMKAPRIVAKGSRLNALRIREIAREHQVPIIENKPLARLMFKYGRVGWRDFCSTVCSRG